MLDFAKLKEASVAVCGLGLSNLPLLDFLLTLGVKTITARDKRREEELDCAEKVRALGIPLVCGEGYLEHLTEEVIFRSPGIRPDCPEFLEATKNGAILTSEMELFLQHCPCPVYAISGSDGKTTSTTLTYEMLSLLYGKDRVFVGGNIGAPLLPKLFDLKPTDRVVLELSSFQLFHLDAHFYTYAITNITPNHLNWHCDYTEYTTTKTAMLDFADFAVLGADNKETALSAKKQLEKGKNVTLFSGTQSYEELKKTFGDVRAFVLVDGVITFRQGTRCIPLLPLSSILLLGKHNILNYMTALALILQDLLSDDDRLSTFLPRLKSFAQHFSGVKHRLETVRVLDGVTYINSSIDSSPVRTAASLSALPKPPIVIVGGMGKGISFAPLAEVLLSSAQKVILTGKTAEEIEHEIRKNPSFSEEKLPIYTVPCFDDAVTLSRELSTDGDIVLLSPACTSFDAFRNFEERGERFITLVRAFESKLFKG